MTAHKFLFKMGTKKRQQIIQHIWVVLAVTGHFCTNIWDSNTQYAPGIKDLSTAAGMGCAGRCRDSLCLVQQ